MNNHQLINKTSGGVEFYTPKPIIEAVRSVLVTIDLDPASSAIANETVKASQFFTMEQNGLSKDWFGRLFMNHPFSKGEKRCKIHCKKKACKVRGYCITEAIPSNADWTNKLVSEYKKGNVTEAICITYASMSEKWMFPLLEFPQCFPFGRVNYRLPNGTIQKGVTKGSVITYLGENTGLFTHHFRDIGMVKVSALT